MIFRNQPLYSEIVSSLEFEERNSKWSQVIRFGRGMAVELEVGELLNSIVRTIKPKIVVETGTHKGFSSLMIAQALKDNEGGHLYTIDVKDYGVSSEFSRFGLSSFAT